MHMLRQLSTHSIPSQLPSRFTEEGSSRGVAETLSPSGAAFIGLEYDNPDRPEAANLLAIYSLVTGMSTVRLLQQAQQAATSTALKVDPSRCTSAQLALGPVPLQGPWLLQLVSFATDPCLCVTGRGGQRDCSDVLGRLQASACRCGGSSESPVKFGGNQCLLCHGCV